MRTKESLAHRRYVRSLVVKVICDTCNAELFSMPQREVNGAPTMAKALMAQATRKHACEGFKGEARVERHGVT